MSDLIYQFSQQPQTLLTNIGRGARQLGGQVLDYGKDKAYQGLLATAMDPATTSPENWAIAMNAAPEAQKENALRTYQITEAERQRKEAAAARAAAEAKYSGAYRAYMDDPNKETLGAMYAASQPLGIFDNIGKTVEAMDTLQQKQQLSQVGEYYSMLYSNNPDELAKRLESDILAYEAEGEKEEAQELKAMLSQLKEGKIKEVTAQLGSSMGLFDGGVEMMENIHSMNAETRKDVELGLDIAADQRAEEMHYVDFIEGSNNIKLLSQERKNELKEDVLKMRNPAIGDLVLEMADVVEGIGGGDPMTDAQLDAAARAWRAEYEKGTQDFKDFKASGDKVQAAAVTALTANGGDGTVTTTDPNGNTVTIQGPADLALINSFQRLIDPATVRQGDIDLMRDTVGGFDRVGLMVDSFFKGNKLTNDQRIALMDMSDQIMDIYRKQEADTRETVLNNTRGLSIPDSKIVPTTIFEASTPEASDLRDLRRKIRANWATDAYDIENATLEELEKEYPSTLKKLRGGSTSSTSSASPAVVPSGFENAEDL